MSFGADVAAPPELAALALRYVAIHTRNPADHVTRQLPAGLRSGTGSVRSTINLSGCLAPLCVGGRVWPTCFVSHFEPHGAHVAASACKRAVRSSRGIGCANRYPCPAV